jgi:hypothetical protein
MSALTNDLMEGIEQADSCRRRGPSWHTEADRLALDVRWLVDACDFFGRDRDVPRAVRDWLRLEATR